MSDPNFMIDPTWVVCGNCKHGTRNDSSQFECRRHPPTAVGFPIPREISTLGEGVPGRWIVNAFYPPVRPDWTCGDFEP